MKGHSLDEFCKPGTVCSIGIPAGEYSGTWAMPRRPPHSLTHDGSGSIRFKVDAKGAVTGSWDLVYVSKSSTGETGTGTVTDGVVSGTPRELQLHGTNVVTTSHGTGTSVPYPDTPLTVQPVCDGHVVAAWERTLNNVRQQVSLDALPMP